MYVNAAQITRTAEDITPVKAWSHKCLPQWNKLDYSVKGFRAGWPETPGVTKGNVTGFYRFSDTEMIGLDIRMLKEKVVRLPLKQLRAHRGILEENDSVFSWRVGGARIPL